MKILFTFENLLPNSEADAEVFITTARNIAELSKRSWLHVPATGSAGLEAAAKASMMEIVPAFAPQRPAALRHFFAGLTLPLRRVFHSADFIYTRNLWVAWMAILCGQRVVFDHYRPWAEQVPPLQPVLYRLFCNRRFLVNICHSDYTRRKYIELGVPPAKLHCVHNGFDPKRFLAQVPVSDAKRALGIDPARKTAVYTGRINHKKGLALLIEAARLLPDILFLLVGSYGEGPIETLARELANIRIVRWQTPERIGDYIFAADLLIIPPSLQPLSTFGSTVLPLKLFLYMGSGRPILAGSTPDVAEVLQDGRNAHLVQPDDVPALISGITALTTNASYAERLAAAAQADSLNLTWERRAQRIAVIIAARLQGTRDERGNWSRTQCRKYRLQSWRWLIHLLRSRSVILPRAASE